MENSEKVRYRNGKNWENVNRVRFYGFGAYEIPRLAPIREVPVSKWIGFNEALSFPKEKRKETGVHFWLDDYQFQRVWTHPSRYLTLLSQYGAVCQPEFSLYEDFPRAIRIYNAYRNGWLGCFWQDHGLTVIPSIVFSLRDQDEFCWDSYPVDSVVAISSVGNMRSREDRACFLRGFSEMETRLMPRKILFYGEIPEEIRDAVEPIECFASSMRRRMKGG